MTQHRPPLSLVPAYAEIDEHALDMQLEFTTRLNPLMNQERIKAMVMALAARQGAVGFWSDD